MDEGREHVERMTALEVLGNVTYMSDVRGVMLIGQYLPFMLSLIDLKRQPPGEIVCRVLGTIRLVIARRQIQATEKQCSPYGQLVCRMISSYTLPYR